MFLICLKENLFIKIFNQIEKSKTSRLKRDLNPY